jgi:CheY-like chemotaxis protein
MPAIDLADLYESADADVTGQVQALTQPGDAMAREVHRQFDECAVKLEALRSKLAPRPRRLLLILVDDEAATLTAMAVSLSRVGVDVHGVGSAKDALAWCRAQTYDAAVVDVWLPGPGGLGRAGIDLAVEMRRSWPTMPIVLISGDPTIRDEAMQQSGADAWLQKPFGPVELVGALAEYLPELKET